MTKIALTIAGSDSSGGAGIQADLKTFAFHCVHGTNALTCVTAQNTAGVTKVQTIDTAIIKAQIQAIGIDFQVNAVKTGMLPNAQIIEAVVEQLNQYNFPQIVIDPVMISRAGSQLIDEQAIALVKKILIPQAAIITPNIYEAQILSGLEINTLDGAKEAAIAIFEQLEAPVILVKGGSLFGQERGTDIWYDGTEIRVLAGQTIATSNTHGTGCTLSAAICANLALGRDLWTSVINAKKYVTDSLKNSLNIGMGNGPIGHFFPLIPK